MISFIIIGRNESKNLKKCITGIYSTIECNCINQYEIIYVDSKSTDNSIAIAKEFKEIKIFKITGHCNAAIGRNIGALESKGGILCFIDADMEVCKEFFGAVLGKDKNLEYEIVSGIITDIENNTITKQRFIEGENFSSNIHKPLDGGIFLIKKYIWESVNGMRTKFINGEDGDLGLRLAKKGFTFTRLNKSIAFHHTVDYLDSSRMWQMVLNRSVFYSNCVLYRDHLLNKYLYPRIWAQDKTLLFLFITVISFFLVPRIFIWLLLIVYLILILVRALRQKRKVSFISLFFCQLTVDILNFLFLFTFFPGNKELKYIAVQKGKI